MSNPLNPIKPVLKLLCEKIRILPAIGGVTEELQHPDVEEIEDVLINRDTDRIVSFSETPQPDVRNIYRDISSNLIVRKRLFRFFIDGSIRTYFLGTGNRGG